MDERMVGDPATACTRCGRPRVWKSSTSTRWRQYCSPCHSASSYASRKRTDRTRLALVQRRQREAPKNRAYTLWNSARNRAARRGITFSLSRDTVEQWLARGVCAVTGLAFDMALGTSRQATLAPSLDRIDPTKGYVDGNVQCVCWLYNRAKGAGTYDDVMLLVEALYARRREAEEALYAQRVRKAA